ncbi:hypothetical protein Vadar_023067 [Vaccinium darrowii]|uniref:Uncharacterized protein n=1 Tax=Vaccinium darrowii TaxID=229202 RepID=A0ACB7Y8Q3_9ERIC|nr:hypothetical protein Vadar_023067 [Vaccinium darrowii]
MDICRLMRRRGLVMVQSTRHMGCQVPNPRIITACLEELENILKVGEVEKNLDNSMDVNYYAQLIHETEGFEKIENLQSLDDDEIYGKWVEILLGHKNAATVSQETSVATLQYKFLKPTVC